MNRFNSLDSEDVVNHIPNAQSWLWLKENIPFFECPDKNFEEIYYYRWWTFRKHIKQTLGGFVLTEFITPVKHAGKYNTISCAVGHHLSEGRWLMNQRYLDDYVLFWLRGNSGTPQPHFHQYSNWIADALYQRYLVTMDEEFIKGLLPDLIKDYQQWEIEKQLQNGLFWQYDVREAIGFIPWYFNLPDSIHAKAWQQALDPQGFKAPFGLTTAERRHPAFKTHGVGSCEWDGAVWPFATTQTLVSMANLLNNYQQPYITPHDYFEALLTYAKSHRKNGQPYIGEYLDEKNGEWLKGDNPRSRFYNHSTFCDLDIYKDKLNLSCISYLFETTIFKEERRLIMVLNKMVNKKLTPLYLVAIVTVLFSCARQKQPVDYINPFIGASTNIADAGAAHGLGGILELEMGDQPNKVWASLI